MSAAPSAHQLLAPWQWFSNQGTRLGRGLRAGLWLGLLLLPPGAAWRWLPPAPAAVITALLITVGLLALWGLHFAALLRLDHPHAARLVPRHAARLRATAVAFWAALSALGGGAAVALLRWAPLPAAWTAGADSLPLAIALAAALLLVLALALRWPLLWLLLWLPISVLPLSTPLMRTLATPLHATWMARPWLACLLLGTMALALAALFGSGSAAHGRAWAQRERWRRIMQAGLVGQKPTLAAYGRWGETLGAPWQRLADAWLAHALRQARPTAASAMTRAEIVLHGTQHWVRQLSTLLPLLLGLMALFAAIAGPAVALQVFPKGQVSISVILVSILLGAVISLPGALWGSRREQALLLLLPSMPRGLALNRALAGRQARHFLMLWMLTWAGALGLAWLGQAPQVLALHTLALPAIAGLWRNVALLRQPNALTALGPLVMCLVPGLAAIALLREKPALLAPLLTGCVLLTALLLGWRWWRLSRWPQALPAGRWG